MQTSHKEEVDIVIDNIVKFLKSEKKDIMNECFFSIKDKKGQRYFEETIKKIDEEDFDILFPLVTTVILTANSIECDVLNYILSLQNNEIKKRKQALLLFNNSYLASPDAYIIKLNSTYVLHLNAYETGSNTYGGSSDLMRYISSNKLLDPVCVFSFGICYGHDPETQEIGDVIVPTKLYPWSIGQKVVDGNLFLKSDNYNLWLEKEFQDSNIYSILRGYCGGSEGKIINEFFMLKNSNTGENREYFFEIKVMQGNMSTGEAVISSKEAKKEVQEASHNERELGGEMEGYGIAKESIFYAKIPCVIFKAICDWGVYKDIDKELDKRKIKYPYNLKDCLQAYAAFCAGIVLKKFLETEMELLLSVNIVDWMGKGKGAIKPFVYLDKEYFERKIAKHYNINIEEAGIIFDLFVRNKNIVHCNGKYCIIKLIKDEKYGYC